eukprot:1311918-Lingulodinium_polyedra.AAC.1
MHLNLFSPAASIKGPGGPVPWQGGPRTRFQISTVASSNAMGGWVVGWLVGWLVGLVDLLTGCAEAG